jgi:hypothetical protein
MAEAYAMMEGLLLATSMGYNRIMVESNSTEVVQVCLVEDVWLNESLINDLC